MIPEYRNRFNEEFSEEKYLQVHEKLSERAGSSPLFRLSESPVFLTNEFRTKLENACESIIDQILEMKPVDLKKAVPENCSVSGDTEKPHFLAIDFGICKNENGELEPQLIELQAFPTLFAFQQEYEEIITEVYPFTEKLRSSMPKTEFNNLFRKIILGDEKPENVILLEIFPERQKTNIDFHLTEKILGIKTVCLTKIIKEGRKLFYENDGKKIQIKRIYNRVIFDELEKIPNLETQFDFREPADVEWITHPNWFFKISKYILPKLHHEFIPKSYFLNEFPLEENLENFVLKPLFSFAGSGVILNPTKEEISKIKDPENYILQRKVAYEPAFRDTDGNFAKGEIRMLYLWDPSEKRPQLTGNIVRMTKAEMANVDFNKKEEIWIGSSLAFFDKP